MLTLMCAFEGVCPAEVVFDGSIGNAGGITGPGFQIPHTRGQVAGGNLFHSFSKFNLSTTETATFTGPASVDNILARVTGGPSSIRGTIRSSIPGANLFLLNPAGIVFGPGAKVEISGAFRASTADYLELADGRRFTSNLDGAVTLLTAAPEAFGFLAGSVHAGEVKAEGSGTSSVSGMNLAGVDVAFVGRRVELKNVFLKSAGAEISLTAVGTGEARVPLRKTSVNAVPNPSIQGEVVVTNSAVSVSNADGGRIHFRGGSVLIDGTATGFVQNGSQFESFSGIDADAKGVAGGGDIEIEASGNIAMRNNSRLASFSRNSMQGGTVWLKSGGEVSLTKGADIIASATASGNGGLIKIESGSLVIDGTGATRATRLSAQSNSGASGAAGSIDLKVAGLLNLKEGGSIVTNTFSSGAGGEIRISAGTLNAAQGTASRYTGIASATVVPAVPTLSAGYGNAGNVTVNVSGLVDIRDSATIESTSASDGNGGKVRVNAGSLFIQGAERLGRPDRNEFLTGILGLTTMRGTGPLAADVVGGSGGDVLVDVAGTIDLIAGGQIDASSFGGGHGGNVTVRAGGILVDRAGSDFFTGIGTDTEAWDDRAQATQKWGVAGGNAGSVVVTSSGGISLLRGGSISSSTAGSGNAGNIAVIAPDILISGSGSDEKYTPGRQSGIVALSEAARTDGLDLTPAATGNAGTVQVTISKPSGQLAVRDGGKISAESLGRGTGGSVIVEASGARVEVTGAGRISARSLDTGDAGVVNVTADQIQVSSGGLIESLNEGSGRAGGIVINSRDLVIDQSQIAVSAIFNDAGRLEITASGDIRMTGGLITATAGGRGNAGNVIVQARDITLSGVGAVGESGIVASTLDGSSGRGGNVSVTSTGALGILRGARIGAESRGSGDAGSVHVNAETIRIDRGGNAAFTGISSDTRFRNGGGNAGDVTVAANGQLDVLGGGLISATTFGSGNAGGVTVSARNILVSGQGNADLSGVTSRSAIVASTDIGSTGRGGNVSIAATGVLTIQQSGQLGAESRGSGAGGDVMISAGATRLLDSALVSSNATGAGKAGGMMLTTGDLVIVNSELGVRAAAADAGELRITAAGDITMSGGLITATAGGSGAGGNIQLTASGHLAVEAGGRIEAASSGSGQAGTVVLTAYSTRLLGDSAFSSKATGSGPAGGVTLNTGDLEIRNSAIDVRAGLADAGRLRITATGDIQLTGGLITATAGGRGNAGDVIVQARDITLSGDGSVRESGIVASTDAGSTGKGGNVSVTATGILTIQQGGQLGAESRGSGAGGDVIINAGSTRLLDSAVVSSNAVGGGKAGGMTLTTGELVIVNSEVGVRAAAANAGELQITAAGDIMMSGGLVTATAGGIGAGGNIRLTTRGQLAVEAGGRIEAASSGSGQAGTVILTTASIRLLGDSAFSSKATGSGPAGGITLSTGDLVIRNSDIDVRASLADAGELRITATGDIQLTGGLITATAGGRGNAGDVIVQARNISLSGAGSVDESGIVASTLDGSSGRGGNVSITSTGGLEVLQQARIGAESRGSGNAGALLVVAEKDISLQGGGQISAATFGSGNAGDVEVSARNILISGSSSSKSASQVSRSGIVASTGVGSSGAGGNVRVVVSDGLLVLEKGGQIASESLGSGSGGSVTIQSSKIRLTDGGLISSRTVGAGRAGDITLNTGELFMKSSQISVSAAQADAGNIKISSRSGILMNDGLISASAGGSGGNIDIRSQGVFLMENGSALLAEAALDGGNITISDSLHLILDHSRISANAINGNGGSIRLSTGTYFANESTVTASSDFGAQGIVRIDPLVSFSGGEESDAPDLLNPDEILQPDCVSRIPDAGSSFTKAGRGGTRRLPGGYLPSFRIIE